MDNRTIAAPGSGSAYTYMSNGGVSWIPPYLAGVYALAKQVDPDLTPEQFIRLSAETATPANPEHYTSKANDPYAKVGVINPTGIIEALEK